MRLTRVLAVCLETVGIVAIMVGIAIEVHYEAEVGFMFITGGSVVVATGGMIFAKLVRGGFLK